jgi:hypothetical protein
MRSDTLLTTHLKIIAAVSKIAQYAEEREPNTLKYCITVPRDTTDETTIYVIEE